MGKLPWILVASLTVACSSSDDGASGPAARAGEIHGTDVWKDSVVLTGTVTIASDAVVEIAPGAKITCAEGGTLFVGGTLRAKAAGAHAKITCGRWAGLVVSTGGHLELEGVELENGLIGLQTQPGAGDSTFTDGAILSSLKPFVVSSGTKLDVARVNATTPAKVGENEISISEIEGKLVASRLDYDANGSEGVSVRNGGELDLQDSTFHAKGGLDLVSAYGAKHVKIAYSTFRGAHCGVHIQPSDSFEIDHITSESNSYGITIYGSGSGPNTVKDSNLEGLAAWLDFQGDNGSITFSGVYTKGGEVMTGGPPPSITKAPQPLGDAKPR